MEDTEDKQIESESQPGIAEAVGGPGDAPTAPVEGEVEEAPPEPAAEAPDELERLRVELEEAKSQAAEYLDGWQRAQAAFSNYRKRQAGERLQMMALASADLLRKLLPVVDDFGRAMETFPESFVREAWFEGFTLIKHKLDAILEQEGVKPIESEGQVFDPRFHEAVTYEVAEGFEEGQIIGEVQAGYMAGERVLRPALVRVAKAAPVEPEANSDTTETEE